MVFSKAANMEEPIYDQLYKYRIDNAPGKSMLGLKITLPPGGQTPPHTHQGASVAASVLSGAVLNKMNDDPMTIKRAGDSWYEAPRCRHRISSNFSTTEEATFVAVLILETEKMDALVEKHGPTGLVLIDEEYTDAVAEQMSKLKAQS
ncbi:MAG: hypothetical protein Q9181_001502 [Wetmoreana brouardii]